MKDMGGVGKECVYSQCTELRILLTSYDCFSEKEGASVKKETLKTSVLSTFFNQYSLPDILYMSPKDAVHSLMNPSRPTA